MKLTGKARKLAMAVAVPGIAIGAFAGLGLAPAMASTAGTSHAAAQHKVFRQEVIFGATRNPNLVIPVSAYGAFRDYGYINLNGPNTGVSGIRFTRGTLRVYHNAGTQTGYVNPKSCYAVFYNVAKYWVIGGTGRYWGAQGWGTAHIRFSGILPRKNGKCDTNANPLPWTTYTTFVAQGPVALKH